MIYDNTAVDNINVPYIPTETPTVPISFFGIFLVSLMFYTSIFAFHLMVL